MRNLINQISYFLKQQTVHFENYGGFINPENVFVTKTYDFLTQTKKN